MKKFLLLIVVGLALVPVLSAAPMCASPLTIPIFPSFSLSNFPPDCAYGGQLLFSAQAVSNGSPASGAVNIFDAGLINGERAIRVNPGLTTPGQDTLLYERITVPAGTPDLWHADLHDLGNAGPNWAVAESVCTSLSPAGQCMGQLGTLLINSTTPNATLSFAPQAQVYTIKDIGVGAGSAISAVGQTYSIPEPFSFLLMGSGLLGLGFVRRLGHKH